MKQGLLVFVLILVRLQLQGQNPEHLIRVPFNLNKPNATFKLDNKLNEISGLTWYGDKSLASVNDEEGIIYVLNPSTGEITETIRFGPAADYEGITYADPFFYITTSSGTIFQVYDEDPQLQKRHYTPLNWKNDVEGLVFNPDEYKLLMACKEAPGLTFFIEDKGRAVYDYDLSADSLLVPPSHLIKKKHLEPFLGEKPKFKPSGIAIDPIDCNIYVLASTGKLLIQLSPDGTVIEVIELDEDIHRQPEGIAFSPAGTLYISNEGGNKKARLHKFNRVNSYE